MTSIDFCSLYFVSLAIIYLEADNHIFMLQSLRSMRESKQRIPTTVSPDKITFSSHNTLRRSVREKKVSFCKSKKNKNINFSRLNPRVSRQCFIVRWIKNLSRSICSEIVVYQNDGRTMMSICIRNGCSKRSGYLLSRVLQKISKVYIFELFKYSA
jgi:hypothetical protein